MVVGLGLVGWFLVAPHASAKVLANHADGAYSVAASPGLGYSYRWDGKGDFGDSNSLKFNLERDQSRKVKLEVKNAFGQVAERDFELSRPKEDKSGLTTIDVNRGANGQLQGTPRPAAKPGGQAPPIQPGMQLPPGHP
jgi:hypothetical protein